MLRLTYQEDNGNWGVAGMNENNEDEKVYSCLSRLRDYENIGLSPNEIERLKYENENLKAVIEKIHKEIISIH